MKAADFDTTGVSEIRLKEKSTHHSCSGHGLDGYTTSVIGKDSFMSTLQKLLLTFKSGTIITILQSHTPTPIRKNNHSKTIYIRNI